jgi:putative membrane protein
MPSYFKAAAAGLAAGLVAAGAMELFQRVAGPALGQTGEGDPATVKAADGVAVALTGHHLPDSAKGPAGEAVHFVTGAALGLAYGVLVALAPSLRAGFGTGYGLAANALIDNAAVPAAGLGPKPSESGTATQAYGGLSHVLFGLALEGVRHALVDAKKD